MECDDTSERTCSFQHQEPRFPLEQVHLVIWEKTDGTSISCRTQILAEPIESTANDVPIHTKTRQLVAQMCVQPKQNALISELTDGVSKLDTTRLLSQNKPDLAASKTNGSLVVPSSAEPQQPVGLDVTTTDISEPLDRVSRLRQRFLQHKREGLVSNSNTSNVKSRTSSLPNTSQNTLGARTTSEFIPPTKISDNKQKNMHLVGSDKKSGNAPLKSALLKPKKGDGKVPLTDILSDRVLKYLPNHKSLPFALKDIEQPMEEGTNTSQKSPSKWKKSLSFTGYVPKNIPKKETDTNITKSPSPKTHEKKSPSKRKIVKFYIGESENKPADPSIKSKCNVTNVINQIQHIPEKGRNPFPKTTSNPNMNGTNESAQNIATASSYLNQLERMAIKRQIHSPNNKRKSSPNRDQGTPKKRIMVEGITPIVSTSNGSHLASNNTHPRPKSKELNLHIPPLYPAIPTSYPLSHGPCNTMVPPPLSREQYLNPQSDQQVPVTCIGSSNHSLPCPELHNLINSPNTSSSNILCPDVSVPELPFGLSTPPGLQHHVGLSTPPGLHGLDLSNMMDHFQTSPSNYGAPYTQLKPAPDGTYDLPNSDFITRDSLSLPESDFIASMFNNSPVLGGSSFPQSSPFLGMPLIASSPSKSPVINNFMSPPNVPALPSHALSSSPSFGFPPFLM